MSDIETGNGEILPECPGVTECEGEATPPCITVAGEGDHHDSSQKLSCIQGQPRKRVKSKGKLMRSLAVCDESLSADGTESRQGSGGQTTPPGYRDDGTDCGEGDQEKSRGSDKPKKPSLSKEPSLEYTDSTGIDLEEFIITTLNGSSRDKMMLLKLEQDMIDFITDDTPYKKFPQMSSYSRMLVHRVAAYFGMEHNVDPSGKAVIINRSHSTRIPEQRFADFIQEEKSEERRFILKRDSSQEKEENQQSRLQGLREDRWSKSIEEREEDYQRARERIFSQEPVSSHENVYIETRGPEDCSSYSDTQRRRQLFRGTRDGSGRLSGSRHSSMELDSRWGDPRPWSSTDSDSSIWTSKPTHTHTGSELSSSSGSCGSLSNAQPTNSPVYINPPPTNNNSPAYYLLPLESSIPPGSILLNPHTGQPFLNPDGTPAIYNPPQQPVRSQLSSTQSQQPLQQAPPPSQPQQPVTSHGVPQVQYSSVSYLPQQLLPVSQHYSGREDHSSQFGHMTLSHQSSGDAPDLPLYPSGAPPHPGYAPPPHGYAPPLPTDSYMTTPTVPPLIPPSQSYNQQNSQAPVFYYPAGPCSNSSPQQCRPAQYNTHTGYPSNQQTAYPGMLGAQPPQTQQSMMGPHPPMSSYQVQPQQQQYPSAMLIPGQGGHNQVYCSISGQGEQGGQCQAQGAMPIYCMPPDSGTSNSCRKTSNNSSISQGWQLKY